MASRYIVQRDTAAWRMQVRISFALAILCTALGVLSMPGQDLDRAFLAIGMFFCLFSSFAVAKTQRDNRDGQVDTWQWVLAVWIAFAAAILLTGWGLWRMNIDRWQKYYMLVGWLFMVSSTFTLSKTIRDAQEATLLEQRSARTRSAEEADAAWAQHRQARVGTDQHRSVRINPTLQCTGQCDALDARRRCWRSSCSAALWPSFCSRSCTSCSSRPSCCSKAA